MSKVILYPLNSAPLLTDQLILVDDPAGTWAIQRVTIASILEAGSEYAEIYLSESTDAITIATADAWHLGVGFLEGDNSSGWTFQDSAISTISSFADYSGTVAGTIKATTAAPHTYTTGEVVAIVGTAAPNDYNGVYVITVVSTTEFYFTNAGWNATTTGTGIRGVNYTAGALAAGKYQMVGSGDVQPASNSQVYDFTIFVNATIQPKIERRMLAQFSTSVTPFSLTGLFEVVAGDIVNVAVKNVGGTANITAARYANIAFHRIAD